MYPPDGLGCKVFANRRDNGLVRGETAFPHHRVDQLSANGYIERSIVPRDDFDRGQSIPDCFINAPSDANILGS